MTEWMEKKSASLIDLQSRHAKQRNHRLYRTVGDRANALTSRLFPTLPFISSLRK